MDNLNMNIKSAMVAAAILLFTYFYYCGKGGSIMSLGTAVLFWLGCLVALALCTILVRLVAGLAVSGFIYPNFFFFMLLPFLVLLLVFLVTYGITVMPVADGVPAFMASLKVFFRLHLSYIAIVSVILGGALWLIIRNPGPGNTIQISTTLKTAAALSGSLVLATVVLYLVKKISQPPLNPKYSAYRTLDSHPETGSLAVDKLLDAGGELIADRPYYLPDKGEVIIIFKYPSSNKNAPVSMAFKLGRNGKLIDSLDAAEISPDNGGLLFEKGYLRSEGSGKWYSWVFDGGKTALAEEPLRSSPDHLAQPLAVDNKALQLDYFHKTGIVRNSNSPEAEWNGTVYYHITRQQDTLQFRLNGAYTLAAGTRGDARAEIEYYPCEGMGFGLIRLNKRTYYIINTTN